MVSQLVRRTASVGVIVIVLAAGFYLGGYTTSKATVTSPTTVYQTTTQTATITETATLTETATVTTLHPSDYVYVRVVSDYNEMPIEGIEFHCSPATVQSGTTTVILISLVSKTNSSGWAYVQWTHSDMMMFETEYEAKVYEFAVPMFFGENYVILSLPSGKVATARCF